jgi:hypothetical protein
MLNRSDGVLEQHVDIRPMGWNRTRFLVQVLRNDTCAVSRHAE